MKSQAGKQNSTGQVNLFSCTECKILLSGRKYCHILSFMTPKTKYEFFFSFISVTKDWKNHVTEFSLCTSLFPPFLVRNLGEGIAHFSFPAFFQEQITTSTLGQQCWTAAHGQSKGFPLPHPHPPLHRN